MSDRSSFKWVHTKWDQETQMLIARMKAFRASVGRKMLRRAASDASKIHLQELKAAAPAKGKEWSTGSWRKSLGRKVRVYNTYQDRTVVFWAVGPRSARIYHPKQKAKYFRRNGKLHRVPITSKTPEKFKTRKYWPVLYSHLIEPKHKMIARANASAMARCKAAITDSLTRSMTEV